LIRSEGINVTNYIFIIACFEDSDLSFNELIKFRGFFHKLFGNDFDGDLAVVSLINSFENSGESSLTENINEGKSFHFSVEHIFMFERHF